MPRTPSTPARPRATVRVRVRLGATGLTLVLAAAGTGLLSGPASATIPSVAPGDVALQAQPVAAPVVTIDPQSQTAQVGGSVTFTAAATGDPTIQWQLALAGAGFSDIPRQNGPTLVAPAVRELDQSRYRAVFTNAGGLTMSAIAVLTVVDPPPVMSTPSAPLDVAATQTGAGEFTITWSPPTSPGTAPVNAYYAGWDGNGQSSGAYAVPTASSATFTVEPGTYSASVVAMNSWGVGTTVVVPVTVAAAPAVSEDPVDRSVDVGAIAAFAAAASGDDVAARWQVSTDGGGVFADLMGATGTTLEVPATADLDQNVYRAAFTNAWGEAFSAGAVLTVTAAPVTAPLVTTVPQAQSAAAGADVTFTAAASGDVTDVRWQVSRDGTTFTDLPGETAPTLVITATEDLDGTVYRAVFTGLGGETFTEGAVLSVSAAPVGAVPSAPRDVVATQTGPRQITITWTTPSDPGGSAITGYDAGYATPGWGNGGPVPADALSAVFDDIDPGDYTASVAAVNAEGSGPRVFVPVTVGPYPATPGAGGGVVGGVTGPPPVSRTPDDAVAVSDRGSDRADRSRRDAPLGELAVTGVEPVDGVAYAVLSLGLGLLLCAASRRRRPTTA